MKLLGLLLVLFSYQNLRAACGANTRTWQADSATTAWNTNNNWNPANRPNAANENAVIISDWFNPDWPNNNYSLGCFEIQSGTMTATNNRILTIVGDYFRNLNPGSLIVGGANTWEVVMLGTAAQTFENVDLIPRLRISNTTSVNLTHSFTIRDRFLMDAGIGSVVIEQDLVTLQTGAINIPAGALVTIESGGAWTLNGNLTIDGILRLQPGATLQFANGTSLIINATGALDINGTPGNSVTIRAEDSSSSYAFTINGSLDAQYLVLNDLGSSGVGMNSSVTRFDNVSINGIGSGGSGITIGGSATLPSSMNSVGFFDDGTAGPFTNINASAYSGADVSMTNWSGIGDTANEVDPSDSINWGTEATAVLQVQNVSGGGIPPSTIAKGSGATQFATFAFSMSGTAPAATNVTSLTLTLYGSNLNSDVSNIAIYNDSNGNCSYDAGPDVLIGNFTPAGSPGTVTVSLSGEINVVDTTQDCLHVFFSTSASATTDNTIGVSIEATDDVVNDQDYALSDVTGPPVRPGLATITGASVRRWNGGFSNNTGTAGNWTPNGVPNTTIDCEIGNGYQPPRMTGAFSCLNTKFQNSGTIDWNNTANIWNIYGAWVVENGFTYQNSNNAVVNIRGAGDQSVSLDGTTFPNDITVNSGGVVTFEDDGIITGNLNLNGGTIRIANGASLQVGGNITVASGSSFDIEPGGELVMGNGSTLTVNSGGTLEIVGTSVLGASVRAVNDTSLYTIIISNGATIRARYYVLRNLGTNGLTVNATATIDASNFLQNGTFIYPGTNNANLLRLFREIPGDVLDGMSFDLGASGATGVISVYTSTGATADSLSMTNYAGDLSGAGFTNDNNYLVSWDSATNELKLTQESTAPASVNQGDVVDMGTFGFEQLNAGSFNDTDITSLRITLTGTGSSADVDSVSLYYDSACSGSGGTLIGTKAFSGNPARALFSSITGATVDSDPINPPLRCFNVEYNINSLATDGKTVGAQIASSSHIVNSEAFDFNSSFSAPVSLGTSTIVGSTTTWTGAVSTNWFTAGNWSGGLPSSTLNCVINDSTRDPVIGSGTATCKSMDIGNGILTHTSGTLEIYGSIESTGTINSGATSILLIRDNGVNPTSQNIDISSSIDALQISKPAGGSVNINSTVDVTDVLSISGTQNFTMYITSNNSLILNGGLTLTSGTIQMDGGSELQIGAGQSLTVNGGTFRTSGTNDAFPQSLSNKAHITNTGGTGTWAFSASSGIVNLTGFYIDWLDTSGLNFSGSVALSSLSGGQLRNLPSSASMRALQFNNSGGIPSTASNFGWNWGPSNSPPTEATAYFLGFSSGCGNQTIDFDQWFGDFWPYTTASTSDKISATNCTILIDRAKSPVSLTHLAATPYDSKVVVEWTTGNEWNHRGFNVYRSLNPEDSFVQINSELIRNDLFSTTIHGTYAFIDEGVSNGETYYYMIEDLSLLGESQLHGPLLAQPDLNLGDPPLIQAGTIASSSDPGGGGGSVGSPQNPSIEISDNVFILSQTESYLRLKVVIPVLSISADPLNPSYSKLSIEGYSPSTTPGLPELLSKTILLPIQTSQVSLVTHEKINESLSSNPGVAVTPAPTYLASGDTFVPLWGLDSVFYNTNQNSPDQFLEIKEMVTIGNQVYLPVVVHALKYNPVTLDLTKVDEIVVDFFLEGHPPWSTSDPTLTPWMREGGVKLGLLEEGMYEVSFEDLQAAGVSAPFEGEAVENIHLMISTVKMGVDILSVDGQFNAGDRIRFYAPHLNSDEERESFALLYVDHNQSSSQALPANVSPVGLDLSERSGFWTKKVYEENNLAIFNEPYTDGTDHFVWSLIYGISGGARTGLDVDLSLPELSASGSVTLRIKVKSRSSQARNTLHNLEIFVNGQETPVAEQSFRAEQGKFLRFQLPTSIFVSGLNKIRLETTGNNLPAGEYDMLFIDKIETYFTQDWIVDTDEALVLDQLQGLSYSLDGFSEGSDLVLYDVSQPTELFFFENQQVSASSLGFKIDFALRGESSGRRLWMGRQTRLKSVNSYQMIGSSHWGSDLNRADIVYIGHPDFLQIVRRLGNFRESQGYEVEYVSLDSIYNEFGNGIHNVSAVKEFVEASRSWEKAPAYFIFLGDGSYDPKGYQNLVSKYRFPVKFKMGSSFDYVSDHWFIADESGLPLEVVARIPAQTASQLENYVSKVLDYETGTRSPGVNANLHLISDQPLYQGEDFETPVNKIKELDAIENLANAKVHTRRSQLSDAEMKTQVINAFQNSAVIHYMGHGAENIWADVGIFDNDDARSLANQKLPVVVAMNCLNAQYADPDFNSLAEELIFNPNGGAVAFWGSTSFTPPTIQSIYQSSFYLNMASSKDESLGELVKMSKIEAGLSSPFEEILYSWVILGDPLVRPAIQSKVTEVRSPSHQVVEAPSSGGGGCSAFASAQLPSQRAPWALILSFFIEVLITLGALRLVRRMFLKDDSKH